MVENCLTCKADVQRTDTIPTDCAKDSQAMPVKTISSKELDGNSFSNGNAVTFSTHLPTSEKKSPDKGEDDVPDSPKECCGQRHMLCLIGLLMIISSLLTRTNINVAMVGMVNYTAIKQIANMMPASNSTNSSATDTTVDDGDTCPLPENMSAEDLKDGEFVWTPDVQGVIFGAFFWGNAIALLPSGYLGQRYGGKYVALIGIVFMGLSGILFPIATSFGLVAISLSRAVGGVGHALTQAPTQTILAKWMPKHERSRMAGVIYSGSPMGTVIALSLTGILTDSGLFGGWPSSFYIFGIVGISVSLLWGFLVYESPADHPWISSAERKYIEDSIGVTRPWLPTPWKQILLSPPVWALLCALGAFHWSLFTLNALMPTYIRTILHFNIKENGLLSALPYLARVGVSLTASFISDFLIRRGLSLTACRKLMITISLLFPAILICSVPYAGCHRILSVSLMTLGMSITGAIFCCAFTNPADLSPNFAGAITSITHIPGNIGGIAAPYLAGVLLKDLDSLSQWKSVFYISGGISVFSTIVYLMFGTAEEQTWNEPNMDRRPSRISMTVQYMEGNLPEVQGRRGSLISP